MPRIVQKSTLIYTKLTIEKKHEKISKTLLTIEIKHDILSPSRANTIQDPHRATRQATGREGKKMKVKELISKLNCSSTLPIRMKEDIYDPGTILAWKYQDVICGGNCTVSSVTITNEEMIIYYQPPKDNR